jgi:hypothetical protein
MLTKLPTPCGVFVPCALIYNPDLPPSVKVSNSQADRVEIHERITSGDLGMFARWHTEYA